MVYFLSSCRYIDLEGVLANFNYEPSSYWSALANASIIMAAWLVATVLVMLLTNRSKKK